MAVALEFLNLVIPIKKIEQHYRGGWGQYLDDNEHLIGRRIWFDDHLVRDGAKNPKDMSILIDEWVDIGLRTIEETNGRPRWVDCCVTAPIRCRRQLQRMSNGRRTGPRVEWRLENAAMCSSVPPTPHLGLFMCRAFTPCTFFLPEPVLGL